jgi:hypothetical protein
LFQESHSCCTGLSDESIYPKSTRLHGAARPGRSPLGARAVVAIREDRCGEDPLLLEDLY